MLRIRQEQMWAFERANWDQFAREAAGHLQSYFPEECKSLGDAALRTNIERTLRRARQHDLAIGSDLLRFLNLAIIFGWQFDEDRAWAREILMMYEYDPPTRVDMLMERAFEELQSPGGGQGAAEEEDPGVGLDGLEDDAMGESIDAEEPEPLAWEPEDDPPQERDPDVDYTAHESDFRDG